MALRLPDRFGLRCALDALSRSGRGQRPLALAALTATLAALGSFAPAQASGQALAPEFAGSYSFIDLGSPPGVPGSLGGLTLKAGTTDRLLIGGAANTASGALYEVALTRDGSGHINGFSGTATAFADAAWNDGGVTYGPGGVLFLARWPQNELGQTKPGSAVTDKVIDLDLVGITSSPGALQFVPPGQPGAGSLKIASFGGGAWYDADVTPDGNGTYNLENVMQVSGSTVSGGPEGIVYVNPGSPQFTAPSMLVSEYSAGQVSAYQVDANGDPVTATQRTFISGLSGAEGAFVDPVTGDFLFSTFGGGSRVIVVRGFAVADATYTVTRADDPVPDGCAPTDCSLREAIMASNATADATDTVAFAIGSGPVTITPTSQLPTISDEVTIDGSTQPGFTGSPIVEINGENAGATSPGLVVTAGNTTIRDLVINRFGTLPDHPLIQLQTNGGNVIAGNRLGTNVPGTAALGGPAVGVAIAPGSSDNLVGGTTASERNVIAGRQFGVFVAGGDSNLIRGNYIGTNAAGSGALPNNVGVHVQFATNTEIGGTAPGAGNLISGNTQEGVNLGTSANSTQIAGNLIGTTASGAAALANRDGIRIVSSGNTVGGADAGARNVISGNSENGVEFGVPASGNSVIGNHIGADASGLMDLGNGMDGVHVASASGTTVGAPGDGNVIFGNDQVGIRVVDAASTAVDDNTISSNTGPGVVAVGNAAQAALTSNSIFANGLLGIDLFTGTLGPTPNDPGDSDTGPNGLQNFPVLDPASPGTPLSGTLDSAPDETYVIELFSSPTCDPSGFGEGQTPLGDVTTTTDGEGNASFTSTVPAPAAGNFVTATATRGGLVTSEFSACVEVRVPGPDLVLTKDDSPDPVGVGGQLIYSLVVENVGDAPATNVTLTDELPAGVTFVGADPTPDCAHAAGIVTCDLGDIDSGSFAEVTIEVTAPAIPGAITNTASVMASEADANPANNSATESTAVSADADLLVSKSESRDPAGVSETLSYSLVVENEGPAAATGVTLTDVLPAGVTFLSSSPGSPACVHSSATRTVTCTLGRLEAGEITEVAIHVRTPSTPGTITNSATVDADQDDPDTANNSATEETTVSTGADLSLLKSDNRDPVDPRAQLSYTLFVQNNGPNPATGVTVTDVLPVGVTFVSSTPSSPDCVHSASTRTVTCNLGSLDRAVGLPVTITVAPTGEGRITNTASVTSASEDPEASNNTATEETEVARGGAVISNGTVSLGVNRIGSLNYNCAPTGDPDCPPPSAGNHVGPVGLRHVPFNTDGTAPGCLCEGWGMADAGSGLSGFANQAAGNANATVDSFVVDGTSRAVSTVTVSDPTRPGHRMRVAQDYHPSASSANLYENTVTVTNTGDNALTDLRYRRVMDWDVEPTAFREWVTIQGSSPQLLFDSDDGFATSDPLAGPSYLSSEAVCGDGYTGGCAFTDLGLDGTYPGVTTPADQGALFDFGFGALAVGESKRFTVYYGAAPSEAAALSAIQAAGAEVYSLGQSSCPAPSSLAECTDAAPNAGVETGVPTTFIFAFVTTTGDLSISKAAPARKTLGEDLTYTLTIRNNGPDPASAVKVSDELPAGVTLVSKSTTRGTCTGETTIECDLGTLPKDALETVTIVVRPSATGSLSNTATVSSPSADAVPGNNSSTATTEIDPAADLRITKSDSPDPVLAGQSLTYTLTATNAGPSAATDVTLSDTLPAGVTFVSAGAGCSEAAGTVTCTLGGIANGESASRQIVVRPTATGPLSNTATVSSPTADPNAGNNSATETTTVDPAADLRITKSDSPDPVTVGASLAYTLTVTNAGPSAASAVSVSDTLPGGVTFVSAGTGCTEAAGTVTCALGTLADGASVSREIVVRPTAAGPLSNTATVSSTTADPSAGNNSATEATTVNDVPTLRVVKLVVNDDGGTKAAADFSVHVKAGGVDVAGSPQPGDTGGTSYTLDPGTYAVSEDAVAGYAPLFSGDCSASGEVALAPGDAKTCTVTNDDVAPTLTVVKHVVNDDGGSALAGAWSMHIKAGVPLVDVAGSPFPGAESPGTTRTLSAGSYVVSESGGPAGYAASFSGDCNGSGQVTLEPGDAKTCTITNDDVAPTLTVVKHVINDDGGSAAAGDWTMHIRSGDPPVDVAGSPFPGAESGTTRTLRAGSYMVGESGGPAGYTASLSGDCSTTGAVTLGPGENKTCTVTNDDVAPPSGSCVTYPDFSPPTGLNLLGSAAVNGDVLRLTSTVGNEQGQAWLRSRVAVGSGFVSEFRFRFTERGGIGDADGPGADGITFAVQDQGADATGNAGGSLGYDGLARSLVVEFDTFDNGPSFGDPNGNHVAIHSRGTAPNGPGDENDSRLGVAELGPLLQDGAVHRARVVYDPAGVLRVFVDDFAAPVLTVAVDLAVKLGLDNGTAFVGFTSATGLGVENHDVLDWSFCAEQAPPEPKLKVIKQVVNDDGGTKAAADFSVHVKAGGVDVAGSPQPGSASGTSYTLEPGSYAVSEDAVAGYAASLSGDCSAGGVVTLAPGEEKTCTVTNDDVAPTLTVVKRVVNDDGGTAAAGDWSMHIKAGVPPADVAGSPFPGAESPGETRTLSAGSYVVSESGGPAGYAASLSGDCNESGQVTLEPGQNKTCTLTNDDVAPTLTVVKRVVNDDGGAKAAADFSVHVKAGGTDVPGSPQPGSASGTSYTLDPGSYTVSEDPVAGYAASLSGDCDAAGDVALALGDTKTCTITNDDVAPTLTVVKRVVNDDGGAAVAGDWTMHIRSGDPPVDVAGSPFPGAESPGTTRTLRAGSYMVGESGGPAGYTASLSGDCSADGAVSLALGENKTCTITNDDVAAPPEDTCDGRPATITGTSAGDVITGTNGADVIIAGAGNDRIDGRRGNDVICGGPGNDRVSGASGDDRLFGESGDDRLRGGNGSDTIIAGDGDDDVGNEDEDGDDRIDAGDGDDVVEAGSGLDLVIGGLGRDDLSGAQDADRIEGEAGNDSLSGGGGNDVLTGGTGADRLTGGGGDDRLFGDEGDDALFGGGGADFMDGGPDIDSCVGGPGTDTDVRCEA